MRKILLSYHYLLLPLLLSLCQTVHLVYVFPCLSTISLLFPLSARPPTLCNLSGTEEGSFLLCY